VLLQYVDVTSEQLLHKCQLDAPSGALNTAPAAAAPSMDDIPISATGLTKDEVFSLSSKPGALKKIVLDFDGHTTANSKWNVKGQPPIVSPPWDTDGDENSFSEKELGQLKAIWSIVAEGEAQQQCAKQCALRVVPCSLRAAADMQSRWAAPAACWLIQLLALPLHVPLLMFWCNAEHAAPTFLHCLRCVSGPQPLHPTAA
jgi:hypothetical protein